MKHYVLLLRESQIGADCWIDLHYIKTAKVADETPELSGLPKTLKEATDFLNLNGFTDATQSLARLEGNEKLSYAYRSASGMFELRKGYQLFPLSLVEFVVNDCAALSVFFFDKDGNGFRNLRFKVA